MTKYRAFTFTLNNYTEDDFNHLKALDTRYKIIAKEIGQQNGTPHLQGYLYFKHQHHLNSLKKQFPTAHWEVAAADAEYNIKYIKKGTPNTPTICVGRHPENPFHTCNQSMCYKRGRYGLHCSNSPCPIEDGLTEEQEMAGMVIRLPNPKYVEGLETDYFYKGVYYHGDATDYYEDGEPPCTNKHLKGMLALYLEITSILFEAPSGTAPEDVGTIDHLMVRGLTDFLLHHNLDEDLIVNENNDIDKDKLANLYASHFDK